MAFRAGVGAGICYGYLMLYIYTVSLFGALDDFHHLFAAAN